MIMVKEKLKSGNKICEACGAQFTCLANDIANCFCNKMSLSKQTLQQIKNKYAKCLCENCLQNLEGEQLK